MKEEIIDQRDNILIRRAILEPGETSRWHTDVCHRFSVIVRGDELAIEYRTGRPEERFKVSRGDAGWDEPTDQIHRAVNVGRCKYEEVVLFFLDSAGSDPQPTSE
jgi:hypothetical protein